MRESSVKIVQETWQRLNQIGPLLVGVFHGNLVKARPELESLLDNVCHQDEDARDMLVMRATNFVIESLGEERSASRILLQLGRAIAQHGIEQQHFRSIEEQLMQTLSQVLGDSFTPIQMQDWHEVFGFVQFKLIAGSSAVLGDVESHTRSFVVRTRPCRRAMPGLGGNRVGYRRLPDILIMG
jgi:hemoglobin-like flavoprotein